MQAVREEVRLMMRLGMLQAMLQAIPQVVLQVVIFPVLKTSEKVRALLHTARTLLLPVRRLLVLSNMMCTLFPITMVEGAGQDWVDCVVTMARSEE